MKKRLNGLGIKIVALSSLLLVSCNLMQINNKEMSIISSAQRDDPGDVAPPWDNIYAGASLEGQTNLPDGSYLYIQIIDTNSTPPHYEGPWTVSNSSRQYGMGIYSDMDEDYYWMHSFNQWNNVGVNILSATLEIRAWDVDSEPIHGTNGEYDGIFIDGTQLNPGFLQGSNSTWSVTLFDVPTGSISDDGNIHCNIDIDMVRYGWLTTLAYSKLTIHYQYVAGNLPPYQPQLTLDPSGAVDADDDLEVSVTGPDPADPNNDNVTYTYRWFVDIGQGYFVDDEFAGRGDHSGPVIPGTDTVLGDIWRVQVTPTDEHGFQGPYAVATFEPVEDINLPPVADAGPDQVQEQTDHQGASIQLDGSGSFDPEGEELLYVWTWDGGSISNVQAQITLPLGSTEITLTVTELQGGLSSQDTVLIIVQDTTPPELDMQIDPAVLWPPNHKLVKVTQISVSDICDSNPLLQIYVTHNEDPHNNQGTGDGDTEFDWQIDADGSVWLRAERDGTGTNRIYTITAIATDVSGNTFVQTTQVTVPHNQ